MASDNHAHYARIGFTVVIGVAAIAATLVYLGGFHDRNSEILVETYFDYPVSGLSKGSPVNMMGVKIGEVRDIGFAMSFYAKDKNFSSADYQRVCILMAIDKDMFKCGNLSDEEICKSLQWQVDNGLRTMVVSSGVTGLSRIEFKIFEGNPGNVEAPRWKSRYMLVPSMPSLFENFSVTATKLMQRLQKMDFDQVWSNVTRAADAAANVSEDVSIMLDSKQAELRSIFSNMEEISVSVKELVSMLKANPSLLLRPSDPEPLKETSAE